MGTGLTTNPTAPEFPRGRLAYRTAINGMANPGYLGIAGESRGLSMGNDNLKAALAQDKILNEARDAIRRLDRALIGKTGAEAIHLDTILGIASHVLGTISLSNFMKIAEDNPS